MGGGTVLPLILHDRQGLRPALRSSVIAVRESEVGDALAGHETGPAAKEVGSIVRELESAAPEIALLVAEGERQAELERQR